MNRFIHYVVSKEMIRIWGPVVANLAVLLAVTLMTFQIKDIVREELKGYVRTEEFRDYQKNHREWGDEVIRGFNTQFAFIRDQMLDINKVSMENNNLIREMRGELKLMLRAEQLPPQNGVVLAR